MKSILKREIVSQTDTNLFHQQKNKERSTDSANQKESTSQLEGGNIKKGKTFNSTIRNAKLTGKDDYEKGDEILRERIIKHHIHSTKQLQSSNTGLKSNNKTMSKAICFEQKPTLDHLLNHYSPAIIDSLSFIRSEKKTNKVFIKNKYSQLF